MFKGFSLKKFNEIFNSISEISAETHFFQGDYHVLPRSSTVLTIRENMTELRVSKLMYTTSSTNGEVTPERQPMPRDDSLVHWQGSS